MADSCEDCGAALATQSQPTLPGTGQRTRCINCETQARARWMVAALPDEGDGEYERLSEWEQGFVRSVKRRAKRDGEFSEKQYLRIEEIYQRIDR